MPEENENLLFFETSGLSMWPFLRGKEKLIVKKIPFADLKLGNLVLYRSGNQLICHRLAKKTKNSNGYLLYTRGDLSSGRPELIKEEMFLGRVVGVVKNNRIIYLEGWIREYLERFILWTPPLLNLIARLHTFLFLKRWKKYF